MIKIAIESSDGTIHVIELEDNSNTGYAVLTFNKSTDKHAVEVSLNAEASNSMLRAGVETLTKAANKSRVNDLQKALDNAPGPMKDYAAKMGLDANTLMADPLFRLLAEVKGIKL